MSEYRIDLHCHSTYSDGSLTPQELLALAQQEGLSAIAITDHDTFEGFFEAVKIHKSYAVDLLPGVEISSEHNKESVHVLGLAFDPQNPALVQFCQEQRRRRIERNRQILQKLTAAGMPVEESEIITSTHAGQTYGRVHIANVMCQKGYVVDIASAFRKYIGDTKPYYVSAEHCTVEEAIEVIHKAHGKAVLAHPHLIKKKFVLRALLEMPFDGIEAFYSRFPKTECEVWVRLAKERGWFVTGGSDFHGLAKPGVRLGCSLTPEDVYVKLKT